MPTGGDYVESDLGSTETTETSLGTITLPATAKRIIGVWGVCQANSTTDEIAISYFRLASDDVPLEPAKFPGQMAWSNTGTVAGGGFYDGGPRIIPVDLPATASAKIRCYMTLSAALTDGAHGAVGVIFQK